MRSFFLFLAAALLSPIASYDLRRPQISRRRWISTAPALLSGAAWSPRALAANGGLQQYNDKGYGCSFSVPSEWAKVDESLEAGPGGVARKLVLFVDKNDSNINSFIAYTPIRGDYTSMSSFGNLDSVARIVIPDGPGLEAEMVSSQVRGPFYFFDYKIKAGPSEPMRRLQSVFAIGHSGTTDALVTFTSQATEEAYSSNPKVQEDLKASIASFAIKK